MQLYYNKKHGGKDQVELKKYFIKVEIYNSNRIQEDCCYSRSRLNKLFSQPSIL